MSKIGNKPVLIPAGVTFTVNGQEIVVKGQKGELCFTLPREISVTNKDGVVAVSRAADYKKLRAAHGLWRSILANAVQGVQSHWTKRLEVVGTGFNAKLQGQSVVLKVGYSHPVTIVPVQGIQLNVEGNNIVIVSGADRQLVGQIAYQIKTVKMPDPYKGKGIRYEGEHIKIKPGKKAKTA